MKMSEFLVKHALHKYVTPNELWKFAKEDFKINPFKNRDEFFQWLGKALTIWARRDGGKVPGTKWVFYCELPFRKSQGSIRVGDRNVGLLMVGNPL